MSVWLCCPYLLAEDLSPNQRVLGQRQASVQSGKGPGGWTVCRMTPESPSKRVDHSWLRGGAFGTGDKGHVRGKSSSLHCSFRGTAAGLAQDSGVETALSWEAPGLAQGQPADGCMTWMGILSVCECFQCSCFVPHVHSILPAIMGGRWDSYPFDQEGNRSEEWVTCLGGEKLRPP